MYPHIQSSIAVPSHPIPFHPVYTFCISDQIKHCRSISYFKNAYLAYTSYFLQYKCIRVSRMTAISTALSFPIPNLQPTPRRIILYNMLMAFIQISQLLQTAIYSANLVGYMRGPIKVCKKSIIPTAITILPYLKAAPR